MNKLQLIAVAFVTAIATLTVAAAPSAMALDPGYTCENGYTGSDSENICTTTTVYTCEVSNNNDIAIINDNTQVAITGDANGGQTGHATNDSNVTFDVAVTNQGVCTVVATKPAIPPVTPEVPKTPETPKVTAPQAEKPAVLAKTSGDKVFVYALAAAASLAAAAGIARIAVAAYARLKN